MRILPPNADVTFSQQQIDTRSGFETDGVEVKVRLDFGGGWLDYRGWHRAG